MKKFITPLIILTVVLFASGMLLSQQNKEDTKFQKVVDNYLDAYWKFYPTAATMAGYHKYDNKLENLSRKNLDKRQDELDKLNGEIITKVDKTILNEEYQIDHELIIDGLDLDMLRHERIIPWEYNPLFYNDIFNNCIRSLIQNSSIAEEANAKNIAGRLKALPKLLKQARENLKTPAQIFTETAIGQLPSILSFYQNDLPQWIAQAPASQKSNLEKNLAKVLPELATYESFLKGELLARSTGTFMLSDAHPRLMRNTLQNTLSTQELVARAQADYKNIRREMFLCCIPLYKIMDPKINLDNPPNITEEQLRNVVIKHVLDKIKNEHTSKEGFLETVKNTVAEIKEFIIEKDLVSLPAEELVIEAMPAEYQGKKWFHLIVPGCYDTSGSYAFQIAPFNHEMTEEQVTAMLEEYNDFLLPFWVIRNVYPGTFVPMVSTRTNPSFIKKTYANSPLIQGWAIYLEEMFVKAGFRNYNTRMRLNQLKYQLRAVQNFILDYNIHESGMTKDKAVSYMTLGGFQTESEAERKFQEIALNPGTAAYAYIGYKEFQDMEKEYRQKKGESFSRKEFLDELLKYGAIPIRNLKKKILQ